MFKVNLIFNCKFIVNFDFLNLHEPFEVSISACYLSNFFLPNTVSTKGSFCCDWRMLEILCKLNCLWIYLGESNFCTWLFFIFWTCTLVENCRPTVETSFLFCFGRKTNLFSGIGRHKVMKSKFHKVSHYFCLPKIREGKLDFREDFYLHMILL